MLSRRFLPGTRYVCIDLGLKKGCGRFLNFSEAHHLFKNCHLFLAVNARVGKNPGFFKKNPAQWVFLGFFGFFWVFWVFLGFFGFFCPDERVFGFFSVSRILLGASRLQIIITLTN